MVSSLNPNYWSCNNNHPVEFVHNNRVCPICGAEGHTITVAEMPQQNHKTTNKNIGKGIGLVGCAAATVALVWLAIEYQSAWAMLSSFCMGVVTTSVSDRV